MGDHNIMDIATMLTTAVLIVSVLVTIVQNIRDTKSLRRDHSDLSKENSNLSADNKEIKIGQGGLRDLLHEHEKNRVSAFHKNDKKIEKIQSLTEKLEYEERLKRERMEGLSYQQQDIQNSITHINGVFEQLKFTASENRKLQVQNNELTKECEQLREKNRKLTNELNRDREQDRGLSL